MRQERPGEPQVEVLDTGPPPGRVERFASSLLARPWVRRVAVATAVVVALAVWLRPTAEDEATGEPEVPAAAHTAPGLRPPPPRGRPSWSAGWKVSPHLAIHSGPRGHTVTFGAVNRGTSPLQVESLVVSGSFLDRPGLSYRGECGAVRRTTSGYRAQQGSVTPGHRVLVRCLDVTAYQGSVATIDRDSVRVQPRCEDMGVGPTI